MFAVQPAFIIVFGHSVGAWSSCNFACKSKDYCMFVGFITQLGFCWDMQGILRQQQSETCAWSLRQVCGQSGLNFVRCIQPSEPSGLSKHGGDVKAICTSEHKEHHDVLSCCTYPASNGARQLFWSWAPLDTLDRRVIRETRLVVASVLGRYGDTRNRRAQGRDYCAHVDGEGGGSTRCVGL